MWSFLWSIMGSSIVGRCTAFSIRLNIDECHIQPLLSIFKPWFMCIDLGKHVLDYLRKFLHGHVVLIQFPSRTPMIPYTLLRVNGLTCCTQTIQGKKTYRHSLSENLRNAPKLQCTKILVTTPRHLSFKIHQKLLHTDLSYSFALTPSPAVASRLTVISPVFSPWPKKMTCTVRSSLHSC